MRCKCSTSTDSIACAWPYHPIQPYLSVKARGDNTNMAEDDLGHVKLSLMTAGNVKLNNLSRVKPKNSALAKFTSDREVLHSSNWLNGDIGPIGLEMDEPSRPGSPRSCSCSNNCLSTQCDKSKSKGDNGVNCNSGETFNIEHSSSQSEIPSIFLSDFNGSFNSSTPNPTSEIKSSCNTPIQAREETMSAATDEYFSDDCVSSSYYVPSTISLAPSDDCEAIKSPAPPIRPPRNARLRREKTHSEADACLKVSYKSYRSQSDPSAHFTTVVKPRALRPSLGSVNVVNGSPDCDLNAKRVADRQRVLQEESNESSAFMEHCGSSRTDRRNRPLFYSRSLDISSPNSDEPVFLENGSVVAPSHFVESLNGNATRSWARSMNDVLDKGECSRNFLRNDFTINGGSSQSTFRQRMKEAAGQTDSRDLVSSVVTSDNVDSEPIHMSLEEVKCNGVIGACATNAGILKDPVEQSSPEDECKRSPCRQFFRVYFRPRKLKKCSSAKNKPSTNEPVYHRHSFPVTMKAAISSLFGLKKNSPSKKKTVATSKAPVDIDPEPFLEAVENRPSNELDDYDASTKPSPNTSPFTNRALPPLPVDENGSLQEPTVCVRDDDDSSSLSALSTLSDNYISTHGRTRSMDYAASIEKVKDCGWYWGPISGETAEKLLANEPDGAFVVRDSSDEHYIFSLTFKLNGWVRHVRIEHDHGNFSFGCQQKFRSNTIVDFIENAVEHSRSGRYLFFLHRRPVLGPMRVQLLHPVSRFKQVQSLQHMCRFVILKSVRRDLIDSLPLPRTLRDYLNTPHYYSEELAHLSTLATVALAASANIAAAATPLVSSRNRSGVEPS